MLFFIPSICFVSFYIFYTVRLSMWHFTLFYFEYPAFLLTFYVQIEKAYIYINDAFKAT